MDQILHLPRLNGPALRAGLERVQPYVDRARGRAERAQRWLDAATAGERRLVGPLHFFAAAAVIGVAAIVATVYTPAYVVARDGVVLGMVSQPEVFEDVVDRVEARATDILGYEYTLEGEPTYEFALTEPDNITPAAQF